MTSDIDTQEKHVRWAYVVRWTALLFPPTIVLSLIYLLVLHGYVTHRELRSHVNWQLTTCGIVLAMIPLLLVLLVIGMSGFHTDDPIAILATFVMAGASALSVVDALSTPVRNNKIQQAASDEGDVPLMSFADPRYMPIH